MEGRSKRTETSQTAPGQFGRGRGVGFPLFTGISILAVLTEGEREANTYTAGCSVGKGVGDTQAGTSGETPGV